MMKEADDRVKKQLPKNN